MANKFLFSMAALTSMALASLTGCAHKQVRVEIAMAEPAPLPMKEEPKPLPVADDTIVLPGELEFDVSRATIKDTAQSREILSTLVALLKDNPKITKLRIEGHTDSTGRAAKNMKLSQARAEAVAAWLVAHDIDAMRLTPVGLGATRPLVENTTAENRAVNRRTEFHLQEVEGKVVADGNPLPEQKNQVASTK